MSVIIVLQKQKKQKQLLSRLRSLLHDTASGTHTISEVLTHFLKRLSSTHSSTRQLAVKVRNDSSHSQFSLVSCFWPSCIKHVFFSILHLTHTCAVKGIYTLIGQQRYAVIQVKWYNENFINFIFKCWNLLVCSLLSYRLTQQSLVSKCIVKYEFVI